MGIIFRKLWCQVQTHRWRVYTHINTCPKGVYENVESLTHFIHKHLPPFRILRITYLFPKSEETTQESVHTGITVFVSLNVPESLYIGVYREDVWWQELSLSADQQDLFLALYHQLLLLILSASGKTKKGQLKYCFNFTTLAVPNCKGTLYS